MIGEELANTLPEKETNRRPPRIYREKNPCYKMTVELLQTYKLINEAYYKEKRRRQELQLQQQQQTQPQESCDDNNYDYILINGDKLNNRYVIDRRIGKGSFGQVVCAWDEIERKDVAVKIIKSKKPFTRQAKEEIRLLHLLNEKDTVEKGCVVRLIDQFMHKNHQCLVFEKLSMNLYDLLRSTKFEGVSFELIKKFGRQILQALRFFAQPDVNIIHCDLKPENILLCEPKRSHIKIIDFGSSCQGDHKPFTYIQSRFYRSPEVILGCEYSTAIDMWSLGCILIEMHSGEPLFSGQNESEQMYLFHQSRGTPPEEMLQEGRKTSQFYEKIGDHNIHIRLGKKSEGL